MSEIDNSGLFKKENNSKVWPNECGGLDLANNVCRLANPFTDFTPLTKRRIRCEHCGATERLISGECAYCRQY